MGAVASVEVPAAQIVLVGATQDLAFTAKDASGNIVAISPGSAFFTSSAPTNLQIADGQAKGVALGVSNVTATVDGKTSAPVEVFVRKANTMEYVVTDIGTLGGPTTFARGLNNLGQVVGRTSLADGTFRAFIWQNGTMTALPSLPSGPVGTDSAHDINDTGKIVGNAGPELTDGNYQLVTWQNSAVESVSETSGLAGLHSAHINLSGQIVFISSNGLSGSPPRGVLVWTTGTLTRLWTLGVDECAINDMGDVAFGGYSLSQSDQAQLHAMLWHQGTTTPLPDEGSSTATDLNNAGQIVGSSGFGISATKCTLWQNGIRTALPTLAGLEFGIGNAINESGEIVGKSYSSDVDGGITASVPVIWRNGAVFDIRTMVPAGSLPDGKGEAVAINDVGQILVTVTTGGVSSPQVIRTFLLTPK
jgi:probable HAF family extracellular repeat protein